MVLQNCTMPLGSRGCSRVQAAIRTPYLVFTRTKVTARAAEGNSSVAPAAPAVTRSELLKGALFVAAAAALPAPARAAAAEEALEAAAPAAVEAAGTNLSKVFLRTLSDCQLAVSIYPTFDYNAAGGGGPGTVTQQPDGRLRVSFDPAELQIPAVQTSTTRILGIPLPPPLKIAIQPRRLEGFVDPATGEAELEFLADFQFTALPLYSAAPLIVSTTLTTESSKGPLREGTGQRLSGDGRARLVGVARVPVTGDAFLDNFLMLPTDALAVLSAEIQFS